MLTTREPNYTATVGLVALDRSIGKQVAAAVKSAGLAIAFQIREPESDKLASPVDVVVVACGNHHRGRQAFKRLRDMELRPRVVACVSEGTESSIQGVLDQGIDGVVWDTRIDGTLNQTIQAVLVGQTVVPADLSKRPDGLAMTNREKQVLSLMIMGLTNREIAGKLFVSENTVKSHLNTAYRKLGVHSRTEAMHRITDPEGGLGTGILAITGPGLKRTREA